jgi:DNA adenine methylase
MEPYLKWAGRKYKLLHQILPLLFTNQTLVEPFVGSGAVFLNSGNKNVIINDINRDIILTYQYLKDDDSFIEYVLSFFDGNLSKERYYNNRELFNKTDDKRLKAALFIWLNRHGFNGLCRYNKSGQFNVPQGSYIQVTCPLDSLNFARTILKEKSITLCNMDFRSFMSFLPRGTGLSVYCDPPYIPVSRTSNFTSYSPNDFGLEEQRQLASYAKRLASRGNRVVISNSCTELSKEIFKNCNYSTDIEVTRNISGKSGSRGKVLETIFVYHE